MTIRIFILLLIKKSMLVINLHYAWQLAANQRQLSSQFPTNVRWRLQL